MIVFTPESATGAGFRRPDPTTTTTRLEPLATLVTPCYRVTVSRVRNCRQARTLRMRANSNGLIDTIIFKYYDI
jgi:hypothetical protein